MKKLLIFFLLLLLNGCGLKIVRVETSVTEEINGRKAYYFRNIDFLEEEK